MKILVVGNAASQHIVNLVNRLASRDVEVYLFTVDLPSADLSPKVNIVISKFLHRKGYLLSFWQLFKLANKISPNLINIHYASGYGLLSNFLGNSIPILLSVWGSDVYIFPKQSYLHKLILKLNLSNASAIASTSICMSKEVAKYSKNSIPIFVTPFGIDVQNFKFDPNIKFSNKPILSIVTVKGLHPVYGIDRLIKSFHLLVKNNNFKFEVILDIYGDGSHMSEYKMLCIELGITHLVRFYGKVSHSQVSSILRNADIFVALSRSESFGVSVLEASACAIPVVVSNADGLKEVVIDGVTGFVVDGDDHNSVALRFKDLLTDPFLRHKFGVAGREMVMSKYTDNFCTQNFINVCKSVAHFS